ncbi:hypothetical protein KRMM14A1259_61350 [Krasilnikovia sp. MM14-A1259]
MGPGAVTIWRFRASFVSVRAWKPYGSHGAAKARIQASGQVDALIVSAPQTVRHPLREPTGKHRIRGCAALRPGSITDPAAAYNLALHSAARR